MPKRTPQKAGTVATSFLALIGTVGGCAPNRPNYSPPASPSTQVSPDPLTEYANARVELNAATHIAGQELTDLESQATPETPSFLRGITVTILQPSETTGWMIYYKAESPDKSFEGRPHLLPGLTRYLRALNAYAQQKCTITSLPYSDDDLRGNIEELLQVAKQGNAKLNIPNWEKFILRCLDSNGKVTNTLIHTFPLGFKVTIPFGFSSEPFNHRIPDHGKILREYEKLRPAAPRR